MRPIALAGAAAVVVLAAVVVFAYQADGDHDSRADPGTTRAAIRAADPRIPMLRKQPGAGPCRIPAGGPRPRLLEGWCGLGVDLDDATAVVTFEERWGPVSSAGDDPSARPFRHRWTVSVVRGRVVRITEHGDLPPQYWR